jgi:hypothetical protein
MQRNTAAGLGYAIAGEYVSMTGLHERAVPRSPPFFAGSASVLVKVKNASAAVKHEFTAIRLGSLANR